MIRQENKFEDSFLEFSKNDKNLYRIGSSNLCRKAINNLKNYCCRPKRLIELIFLPKDFKTSVKETYASFVIWSILSSICLTVSTIIAFEALFFSVLFANETNFLAAAANWIIKDGIGQLGAMLAAYFINTKYDSQPRQWRFLAGIFLDLGSLIECFTPFAPNLFLLIASTANVFKNIGWVSASASRAAIHKSFTNRENLADVTAKAASQSIFASIIGTAIGVFAVPLLSQVTNIEAPFQDAPHIIVLLVVGFNILHLILLWISLKKVHVSSLDLSRLVKASYLSINLDDRNFEEAMQNPMFNSEFSSIETEEDNMNNDDVLFKSFLTPKEASKITNIIQFRTVFKQQHIVKLKYSKNVKLSVGKLLTNFDEEEVSLLEELFLDSGLNFCVVPSIKTKSLSLTIILSADSNTEDIFAALLCAMLYSKNKNNMTTLKINKLKRCHEVANKNAKSYIKELQNKGWKTKDHFLEPYRYRIFK